MGTVNLKVRNWDVLGAVRAKGKDANVWIVLLTREYPTRCFSAAVFNVVTKEVSSAKQYDDPIPAAIDFLERGDLLGEMALTSILLEQRRTLASN